MEKQGRTFYNHYYMNSAILNWAGLTRPVGLPQIQHTLGVLRSLPGARTHLSPGPRGGSRCPIGFLRHVPVISRHRTKEATQPDSGPCGLPTRSWWQPNSRAPAPPLANMPSGMPTPPISSLPHPPSCTCTCTCTSRDWLAHGRLPVCEIGLML